MPAVTVVVPVYNPQPELLLRVLQAVLSNRVALATGDPASGPELVVVDDGSRDARAVAELVGRFPGAQLVRQKNAGVSAARNRGVDLARSAWIAFCDQDDVWLPGKLLAQMRALGPTTVLCYTDFNWIRDGQSIPGTRPEPYTYLSMLADGHICLSSALVRRQALVDVGGFDPLLNQQQDFDVFLKLMRRSEGQDVVHVERILVDYHLHAGNASRDYRRAYLERHAVLQRHGLASTACADPSAVQAAVAAGLRQARRVYAYQAVDALRLTAKQGSWRESASHACFATRLSPRVVVSNVRHARPRRLLDLARGQATYQQPPET